MNDSLCPPQPLPSPADLAMAAPLSSSAQRCIHEARERVTARLRTGRGPVVAIVGPCSIHDRHAAVDYARRLKQLQVELGDDVLLVMRAYFEKPRTSVGWKGFLYDPDLDGSDDLERGLREARGLLVELAELGVPTATELLEPLVAPYLSDLITWAAIGARTSESQPHRQLASHLPLPVGFKNGTDGNLDSAVCAVVAARSRHSLVGVDASGRLSVLQSRGNQAAHVVLRGGRGGTNYDAASVAQAAAALQAVGADPAVVIDCSHGNSGKDYRRQPVVARSVIEQLKAGMPGLAGFMLESFLVEGRQDLSSARLTYGQSVTDACVDFPTTVRVMKELTDAVRQRASAVVRSQPTLTRSQQQRIPEPAHG